MQVYTVSDFVHGINELLSGIPVCVQGEVSNFKVSQNRFVWFDLKDDKSYVSCFMLAFQLEQDLTDGTEIQVIGYPALFAKSGRFHVRVNKIQLMGEGSLKKQYEQLKAKLTAEGLFAAERKRTLPKFPNRIGLVTSGDAAAYTDVLKILKQRWAGVTVVHFPVQVQGAKAVSTIVAALQMIKRYYAKELDVVIVTRGGGSMEDLQAFNDEQVVRAIFALPIPSVAAIGHERDITLAELVADVRASTPSNAAELTVPDKRDVLLQLLSLVRQQGRDLQQLVDNAQQRVANAVTTLDDQVSRYHTQVQDVQQRFHIQLLAWASDQQLQRERLDHSVSLLQSYNPRQVLQRGYSITTLADGTVITSTTSVQVGTKIKTTLRDGEISSKVI